MPELRLVIDCNLTRFPSYGANISLLMVKTQKVNLYMLCC